MLKFRHICDIHDSSTSNDNCDKGISVWLRQTATAPIKIINCQESYKKLKKK